MPRRQTRRCESIGGADIELPQEHCCVWGHAWGFSDLLDIVDFEAAWRRWGAEIESRYRAAFPGSRPAAVYYLGLVPAPTWMAQNPPSRFMSPIIRGCRCERFDLNVLTKEHEFRHLLDLGVLDDQEVAAARKRFKSDDATEYSRYQSIYREQLIGRAG
jgi:hypothetical protein